MDNLDDNITRALRDAGRDHQPDPDWQRQTWKRIERRRMLEHLAIGFIVGAIVGIIGGVCFALGCYP